MLGTKTNQKCECGNNLYKTEGYIIYCPKCGYSNDDEFADFAKKLNQYVALKQSDKIAQRKNKQYFIASLCFAAFWIGMLFLWMVMS